MSILVTTIFGALQSVQDTNDDPFDGIGHVDDIDLPDLTTWVDFALSKYSVTPTSPSYTKNGCSSGGNVSQPPKANVGDGASKLLAGGRVRPSLSPLTGEVIKPSIITSKCAGTETRKRAKSHRLMLRHEPKMYTSDFLY